MKFQYLDHTETKLWFERMELYYRCNVQCNHSPRIVATISVRYLWQFQMQLVLIWHLERIFRITDFSYPRPFVPKNERSLWRTFIPQERKFQEFSFPGPFVPGTFRSRELSFSGNESSLERKFPGTFVPGPFRSRELSFLELSFLGPFVPGNSRSHYPIGLVAALLCVLKYCMFGCDFTLMMLTPL